MKQRQGAFGSWATKPNSFWGALAQDTGFAASAEVVEFRARQQGVVIAKIAGGLLLVLLSITFSIVGLIWQMRRADRAPSPSADQRN